MIVPLIDLAVLEPADLRSVRLGAQIMGHKASLGGRERVEGFFAALAVAVDAELARSDEFSGPRHASVGVPFAERDWAPDVGEDRRLLVEYLDLLSANPRLSPAVRGAYGSLRNQLADQADEGQRDTTQ